MSLGEKLIPILEEVSPYGAAFFWDDPRHFVATGSSIASHGELWQVIIQQAFPGHAATPCEKVGQNDVNQQNVVPIIGALQKCFLGRDASETVLSWRMVSSTTSCGCFTETLSCFAALIAQQKRSAQLHKFQSYGTGVFILHPVHGSSYPPNFCAKACNICLFFNKENLT